MNIIKIKAFWVIVLMALMIGCSDTANKEMADNALDGGRYFIENCMHSWSAAGEMAGMRLMYSGA
jgi:hypothetical protein